MPIKPSNPERNLCMSCLKPKLTCYCAEVRPFEIAFELILLQHPMERKRTVGTARMTHRCIGNSRLIQGTEFGEDAQVNELLQDPLNHCVVLYPGQDSLCLEEPRQDSSVLSRDWVPAEKRLVVFVIDGTWACARKMLNRSPNLLRLPQICFRPDRASEYQFRQQPHPQCLSTIEAVHRLLAILDPRADRNHLLELFRRLVSQQVGFAALRQLREFGSVSGA